ncbi:MAG: hypothetical protein CVU63_01845 [Deltaproteobacteria bacterium HGW-Deltaproteobacteria-20]|nr:MAG: hypothetical protein CVU63_01845 [Deltaproteobacteria bacterium HGW-Deltaproteobacteria-20]
MTPPNTSSDLPPWARKLFLGFFVAVVVPLAIYGVYRQVVTATDVMPVIQQDLLDPYAQALAAGDFDRARTSYTSAEFQQRVGRDDYRAAQARNRNDFGAAKAMRLYTCNETKEPGRPWFTSCDAFFDTEKGETPISLEIVEHEGQYRIDRAFLREGARTTRVERVF